jgi:pimeloyl-ACP methyl ester carboxylesterase
VPAQEAAQLVRASAACTVVDDVFATIRSGSALMRDLDRIQCPVVVCWGDKDRILPLPKHGPRFRDEIPGVEFRVWKGLGHTPMWDDPGLIAGTIADWAASAQQRAAAPLSAA